MVIALLAGFIFVSHAHALQEGDNNGGPSGSGSVTNTPTGSSSNVPAATSFGDCNNGNGVKVSVGINGSNECVGTDGENPIFAYIKGIMGWLAGLVGVVITLALIIAGFQWMTSQGQPDKLKKAKLRIVQALTSLLLFIFMAAILRYLIPNIF